MFLTVLMYVLFIVGLVLIIKGGDWFVDSASWIAEVAGVPKFVIGATIVSIATTLPEMIVSITATAKGNVEMAAGNAIGSVTANTAMIMGIFIVCMPFAIERKSFSPKAIMMFLASATLVLGCIFTAKEKMTFVDETGDFYHLTVIGLIVLILIFVAFFIENFTKSKQHWLADRGRNYSDKGKSNKQRLGKKYCCFYCRCGMHSNRRSASC